MPPGFFEVGGSLEARVRPPVIDSVEPRGPKECLGNTGTRGEDYTDSIEPPWSTEHLVEMGTRADDGDITEDCE